MVGRYIATLLTRDEIDQAFPLVQAVMPDFTLSHWKHYASDLGSSADQINLENSRSQGIVAVRSDLDYLHGLFCYRVDEDAVLGRLLWIDTFVALDFLDGMRAAGALLMAMEKLARKHMCSAIRACLTDGGTIRRLSGGRTLDAFCENGFQPESLHMIKKLAPAV